ncbi:interferon-inducible GTPase 1-like isoform X2 [Dreissena polymorpha]|uniref:interferon-inducible GTPase 1-like isoform X2 n=1 Tax=Dreissena polymorpha TaxID=45954 RepID=UPI0022650921|nr:interferon-inducible GTPase 1-like isoform X2 [Dreissena polymorpha]
MNCSKCLKPLQENWKRCPVCKTNINATRCPLCNIILLDGWTCCPNCDNSDEELEGAVAADIWHDAPDPVITDIWHDASESCTDYSLPLLQKSFRHDCKSREAAEQFIFDRDRNVAHAHYMVEQEVIHEEEESGEGSTQESHDTARPALSEIDEARLNSCLDKVRSVLGERVPEHLMKKVILRHNFSIEEALNELLNQQVNCAVSEDDQRKGKDEHEPLITSIVQYLQGFEDGYKTHGIARVYALLKTDICKWKTVPLKILVTGEAGVGKSSFINAMLGLNPCDGGGAEVGVTETTTIREEYKHPHYQNFVLIDCPGVGTLKCPKEKYLKLIDLQNCDFVIIISCSRFKENDAWLATETTKAKKKFYFVRSKIDQDIKSESEKQKGTKSSEVVTKVEDYCKKELSALGFEKAVVFIISSRFKLREKFHLKQLINTLLKDIPILKRDALIFSISLTIKPVLDEKRTSLMERIGKIATTAACRVFSEKKCLSILHEEIEFYQEQLGVNEERLMGFARQMDMNIDALKKEIALRSSIILNDPLKFREFCLCNTQSRKDITVYDHRSTVEKFFSRKDYKRYFYAMYDLLMMCYEESEKILKLISTKV